MTFEERVALLMFLGMSREDAEWQVAAYETPQHCLIDTAKTGSEPQPK